MPYPESDLIAISALQHYIFCPRQCALIHIEQAWEENSLTAEGRNLHDRAHGDSAETRPDCRRIFWHAIEVAGTGSNRKGRLRNGDAGG